MTKSGNLDNSITYEHICDSVADMNNINPKYITLGSTCIVLDKDAGLEVYMARSDKSWILLSGSFSDEQEE